MIYKVAVEVWLLVVSFLTTHLLTHSLTHSLIHSLIHSLTHSLTHSFTQSLTHTLTHSLTHSLTHLLTHSFSHSLTQHCLSVRYCASTPEPKHGHPLYSPDVAPYDLWLYVRIKRHIKGQVFESLENKQDQGDQKSWWNALSPLPLNGTLFGPVFYTRELPNEVFGENMSSRNWASVLEPQTCT